MRILFVSNDLNKVGGIQKYNADFLSAFESGKERVFVLELKGRNILSKLLFSVKVVIWGIFGNFNVVVLSHVNFLSLGNILSFFGRKFIVLTYGVDVWNLTDKQIKFLKKAARIVSISKYTIDKIKKQIKNIDDEIFILPNAIRGDEFFPKEKSKNLINKLGLADEKIIFTLGRLSALEKYKGYDQTIRALPKILKRMPNVRYILGGFGDDVGRVKDLINSLELNDKIILAGYIPKEELVDYYNLADVFVMPSKGEGFGFVFLEALACGKPVIAGNSDGSVDAVLDGKAGILVDPDNIEEVAEAVLSVLEQKIDSNLLNKDYLRKKILEAYGIDKFKEKVINLVYGL